MAAGASTYAEKATLDQWLGGAAATIPGTVYVALYSAAPGAGNASGTELSGSGYARVAVTNNATNWPASTGSNPASKSNGVAITFPTATADWVSAVAFAIYDASSAGNELFYAPLTAAQTVQNGGVASFAIGALSVTCT